MRDKRYFFVFCAICATVVTAITIGAMQIRESAERNRSGPIEEATAATDVTARDGPNVSPPPNPGSELSARS